MKHKLLLTLAVALTLGLSAVILPKVSIAYSGPAEERYIVVLRDSVTDSNRVANEHARSQKLKVSHVYSHALKGYSATMSPGQAKALERDSRVAYVELDGIASIDATQTNASWGLDRIDQRQLPLDGSFTHFANGSGVKAYIIDTGIKKSHTEFGGRAIDGYDAVDGSLPADDCNGHGTHVAGTAGGTTYGVAKGTTLLAVRVLDCYGSGYWSWVIAGIDYVTANHTPGQPAVANMSLGGSANTAVDTAVRNSIASGVSYAVAAGNSYQDACKSSPARVTEAMTVSATDKTDTKPNWSNWGPCVDWFAPGVSIRSAWFTSNSATNTISGSSMASPHAAGVAALYLQSTPGASPGQVRDSLYAATTKSIVKKAKSTNNHLLFTNY